MFAPAWTMLVLIMTSRSGRYIYEFIMGNKHEVLGSKAKLWRSEGEAPSV